MLVQAFRRVPGLLRFVLVACAFNLLLFLALRLAFWLTFRSASPDAPLADVLQGLYLGLKFDIRLALLIGLPPLALGALPLLSPVRHVFARRLWLGYLVAAQMLMLLLYFIDFGHFDFLHTRLNAGILEHFRPLAIALQFVWESYPVIPGIGVLALAGTASWWALRRFALPELGAAAASVPGKWPRRALAGAVLAVYVFGIWGKWSFFPLRWSDAYFSPNAFVAALAINPVLFLADTLDNRSQPYDVERVRADYDFVAQRMEVTRRDRENLSFARNCTPRASSSRTPNLVVIHLESMAAFKLGMFGNAMRATPRMDAIAQEGVLFTDFFVPAAPTARAVFSWVTGIPDYNVGRSASRNPLVIDQHTLVNALHGYSRFYFLGGSAAWANIRGLLAHNIRDLQIFEEGSYDHARTDVWGVSDLGVFEKAHAVLSAQQGPFFAFIQTAGNHKPFHIPDNPAERRGFEPLSEDEQLLRANGFESLAAYNGLRYFDHALGHFFDLARQAPWFRDTVFVLYGDHGNHATHDIVFERLGLTGAHSPLIVYAPGRVPGGRVIDTPASLLDLLPTALGIVGVPYLNTTLGRDLFAPRAAEERFALLVDGLLDNEFLLKESPAGGYRLHRYRSQDPTRDLARDEPEKLAEMTRLREALRDTARYLLYHNPPRTHPGQADPVRATVAR
jgi:phosphoglycerol transferase MdoB-like AlkP superfamily enzyme